MEQSNTNSGRSRMVPSGLILPPCLDQLADRHLSQLGAFSVPGLDHISHELLEIPLGARGRNEQRGGLAPTRDHDLFSTSDPIEEIAQACLRFKCAYGFHGDIPV